MRQTGWVVEQLLRHHPSTRFEVVGIRTEGDRNREAPLSEIGGTGLFVKELELALQEGRIDLAVHSLKDMPARLPEGLTVAAVPQREDARDVLVSRLGKELPALPEGARVGTSSRRRAAQLLALRPDLQILNLRGNVDTRLRKAEGESYDAIVLAAAGLIRLGRADRITQVLPPEIMLPAVGQGALAVEIRADDRHTRSLVAAIDHPPTRAAVTAERAFLARLGGGCQLPIAGYAVVEGDRLWLRALLSGPAGTPLYRSQRIGTRAEAASLGRLIAEELLERGAGALLKQMGGESPIVEGECN
jgi:hydroxymethylbilane synthase